MCHTNNVKLTLIKIMIYLQTLENLAGKEFKKIQLSITQVKTL